MSMLSVENLKISFKSGGRLTEAVKGVSFDVGKAESVAIVGESGSGKSVTAMSLARLLPQDGSCEVSGRVLFDSKNIFQMGSKELRALRGGKIAYVFQEPSTSLNPVFSVGEQIAEAVRLHRPEVKDVRACVVEALEEVGIRRAAERYSAYPHELSGGMQQRVMIAMALSCRPRLLVADEPTTALDVTIQKQIIDLLKEILKNRGMSLILITHNFGIIKGLCSRVLVMFRGRIVESGATEEILYSPKHPYTKALIACIPRLGRPGERLVSIDYEKIEREARELGYAY